MSAQSLDLGVGDAHVPGAIGSPPTKVRTMATITAKQRRALPKSKFADPANRAYPIHDKAHADNAMARLEQQKGSMSQGKYLAIKRRIRAAQRSFGEKPTANAMLPSTGSGKAIHIRMTAPDGSHTTIRHTLAACRNDGGKLLLVTFDELGSKTILAGSPDLAPIELDDGRKLVWVQVARCGAWAGHPQGAFEITPRLLDAMAYNFVAQKFGRIQWDFDHYAAMPANSGNLPVTGKPAQGWAYEFKRVGQKLYALTEWKPLAREYLENDQYQGVSPVIDWNGKDRETGKPIGPVITSIALTNVPFLTEMERPLAASVDGVTEPEKSGLMPLTEVTEPQALSSKYSCHSLLGMLPRLKQTFGMHELSTVEQLQSALENYRAHLDALDGDGEGEHEGVNLRPYSEALREMTNAHAGMDWYAILDIIDELVDAYLDQHGLPDFEESHGPIPGAEQIENSAVVVAASIQGAVMAEPAQKPEATVAPEVNAPEASTQVAVEPQVEPATVTAASADGAEALPSPEVARLVLENAELKARLEALSSAKTSAEVALTAANEAAQASQCALDVDAALETYRDTKGLKPEHRPYLLSHRKNDPAAFAALYPPVEPSQRHLLLNLTGGGASNPQAPGVRVEADTAAPIVAEKTQEVVEAERITALGLFGLTQELISKDKLSPAAAQRKASQLLDHARKQGVN